MNNNLPNINHETVVFTKHARERLNLRRLGEDMVIQVMQKPNNIYKIEDGKIKFVGKVMGAKVHAICKPIPEENKWLVVTLWVRGEDDAGNFVNPGKFVNQRNHRRQDRDTFSRIDAGMFFLLIFLAIIAYYFMRQG